MKKILLGVLLGILTTVGVLNGVVLYSAIRAQQCVANEISEEIFVQVMMCLEEAQAPSETLNKLTYLPAKMIFTLLNKQSSNQKK